MTADNKALLRARYRKIRGSINNREIAENIICDKILKSDFYNNCLSVFLYASTASEVSVDKVIADALKNGKKVALPLCADKNGNMEFYYIKSLDDIKLGMYNIREPDSSFCEKAHSDNRTICFVPGLCFDKKGFRLGYGKGYYDRFLGNFNGFSVGVAFDDCVTDNLPRDEFDKNVSYLITDKKIYNFNIKEE